MSNRLAVLLIATTMLGGCTAIDEMTQEPTVRAPGQVGYMVAAEPGQTLESIATRYDLPSSALIEANHLRPPYTLRPHQTLIIPPPATYRVHDGDSVAEIATLLGVDEVALARANGLQKPYHMHVNQVLRVPGGYGDGGLIRDAGPDADPNLAYVPPGQAAVTPRSSISAQSLAPPPGVGSGPGGGSYGPQPMAPTQSPPAQNMGPPPRGLGPPQTQMSSPTALAPQAPGRQPAPPQTAFQQPQNTMPQNTPPMANPPPRPVPPAASQPPASTQQALVAPAGVAGAPHFIRPVSGQTVQGFGADGSGQTNDGINITAAAGTSVQAADAGTVIYTGNELAAFGNLVLIRHAGGWVTAYGHLGSIGVQRGATVTQGQPIGTVGQTGSASAPQLHFEIRQGSKPVDPAPFLSGRG
ncbi:MAG: putative gamma-D-glutamyl-meso-diaminopimelate peptidase [Rhodospirillales bacterium]|nr:putative gamma-D-glutamyl-meso-diaminopimelate peptidase [Rhodospirillales bacterium]